MLARADVSFAARPEPVASRGVIDLGLERLYTLQMRVLEDSRELLVPVPPRRPVKVSAIAERWASAPCASTNRASFQGDPGSSSW
jgi:hypothetical protein